MNTVAPLTPSSKRAERRTENPVGPLLLLQHKLWEPSRDTQQAITTTPHRLLSDRKDNYLCSYTFMLVGPQGLYFSVYLTFGFHHNKSEQSKLAENSALNLKPSYFPFLSCLTLPFAFSYILHHTSIQRMQIAVFSPLLLIRNRESTR